MNAECLIGGFWYPGKIQRVDGKCVTFHERHYFFFPLLSLLTLAEANPERS